MLRKVNPLSSQIGAAIRAFRSENCPSCDAQKITKKDPFCKRCFKRLPPSFRQAFHDRSRFIELFHPAMAHLRKR
jgi:predicted amidophosphoribosyltransferase